MTFQISDLARVEQVVEFVEDELFAADEGFDHREHFLYSVPEHFVHGDRVVGAPQEATALDAHECQDVTVVPRLGGHTCCTTGAADEDTFSDIVIGIHRCTPWFHACVTQLSHVGDCVHDWTWARRRTALHAHDRAVAAANEREVDQQHAVTMHALEGHQLELFQRLRPAFAAVFNLEYMDSLALIQVLCVLARQRFDFPGLDVRVVSVDNAYSGWQLVEVNDNHIVVVATADAGARQQQVEHEEGRSGSRAVGEHFHWTRRLIFIAVLQVAA